MLGHRNKYLNEDLFQDFFFGSVVNNEFSVWTSVLSGIPQGSVLGPSLFTIFINDIPNDITSNVKMFADDTKFYNSAHLNHLIQEDLNCVLQWSNEWLLPFNIEKCKVLHHGKVNPKNDYMMNYISVLSDSSIKDLGITFQDTLTFDEHITQSVKLHPTKIAD